MNKNCIILLSKTVLTIFNFSSHLLGLIRFEKNPFKPQKDT